MIKAKRAIGFLSTAALAASIGLLLAAVPAAAEKDEDGPRRELLISSASADPQLDVLTIGGKNFGNRPAVVILDSLKLVVMSSTPNQILASLPPGLLPGSYRLTVTRGHHPGHDRDVHSSAGDVDVFDVTLGSVGPVGPTGEKGDMGDVGPEGQAGSPGLASFNDLTGMPCSIGSATGTIALTFGSGGVATLTCVLSPLPPPPPPNDCPSTLCPGYGQGTANVGCTGGTCTFSCVGEKYDVDGSPLNGCEVGDIPTGNHTQAAASRVGSFECVDSSTFAISGLIPSDTRRHENPGITGFGAASGAAPDWFVVEADGGSCTKDLAITLTLAGVPALPNCYQLTVVTAFLTLTCVVDSTGSCTVSSGGGSYPAPSDVFLKVEKTCGAARTNLAYGIDGHL